MTVRHTRFDLGPALATLRSAIDTSNKPSVGVAPPPVRVFVTVARQPGSGAILFAEKLAQRLNQDDGGDWSAWDTELVERVSKEHGISKRIVELLEDKPHHWLDVLVASISTGGSEDDVHAYKRVMITVRTLATAGHAVIVGMGGSFITAGMPGGIHLRLVAPLEHRIQHMAEHDNLSMAAAAARVSEIDRNRAAFYRRFWPGKAIIPENYTMTLNSGQMNLEDLVETLVPLIRLREKAKV